MVKLGVNFIDPIEWMAILFPLGKVTKSFSDNMYEKLVRIWDMWRMAPLSII